MVAISTSGREALLSALLDTAAELSSLRDVESVLASIVRRTRQLVRSDMAYISLNDHTEGTTYIRQSDGVATSAYRSIRMPIGTGILGLVAAGEAPYQTTDYLPDASVQHIAEIDEIVAGEGVRTIMGVPLVVGGRVIGALMVAERSHRVFSPDEVSMVDSLGKHAAVALDNAEKYAQALRDAELLSRKNAQNQQELLSLAEIARFDEELLHAVLQSHSTEEVLEVTARTLALPVALLNERGDKLSVASPPTADRRSGADTSGSHAGGDPVDFSPASLQQCLKEVDRAGRAQVLPLPPRGDGPDHEVVLAPVRSSHASLGYLLVGQRLSQVQQTLLERAASHCALALLFLGAEEDAQHRAQLDVLDELLRGEKVPRSRLDRRLRHWGLSSSDRVWVAAIAHPSAQERQVQRHFRQLPGTGLLAAVDGELCAVFTSPDWVTGFQALDTLAEETFAAYAGPMDSVTQLPAFWRRAKSGLAALRYSGQPGIADASRMGLVASVVHLAAESDHADLTAEVSPLLEYDAQRGTSLTATALAYFDADRRIDRTAEALFMHRNTVRQRLGTITKLLGRGWDAAPRALDVHLSLRAWALSAGSTDVAKRPPN
ncbi:helix-turn-helix domain-containing protein [Nesterenkonia sphaerica]|uniref:GAF domain-containing protein n=1 Tax=Nesterenkonia sphaerica TaxID=1804988 RepID=A0A5R9A9Z5_9MICC|nr:GAF domain-containing protein [Nesterenkonia sphaerica]TLP75602.1 GAF domain-containing protein [Nesterenkonia sphaerica]